jgi:hypothetical protein
MVFISNHGHERLDERYDGNLTKQEFANKARHKGKQAFEISNKKLANHLEEIASRGSPIHVVKYYKGYVFVFGPSVDKITNLPDNRKGLCLVSMWKLKDKHIKDWNLKQ